MRKVKWNEQLNVVYIFISGAASLSATYLPSLKGFFLIIFIAGIVFCYERERKKFINSERNIIDDSKSEA